MKNLIRRIFFGDTVIREYSTITIDGGIRENVYLDTGDLLLDVSLTHWLLCLDPIVVGIWIKHQQQIPELKRADTVTLYFSNIVSDKKSDVWKNAVAAIEVTYINALKEKEGSLVLFKLKNCRIFHTDYLRAHLLFHKYYKKPGFTFDKFKGFAAAYSYPRRVRLISFKGDDYYNIFPMDLVGDISSCDRFVFGLRHTNITLAKIIETGKLVVSEVAYDKKDIIYNLGKHHGSRPPSLEALPFGVKQTSQFGFYIPDWIDSYKEVNIVQNMSLGSHMLLWGKVINKEKLKDESPHLYHIHFLLHLYQARFGLNYISI